MHDGSRFRPVAPSYLRLALQSLLNRHFTAGKKSPLTRDAVSLVVDSANGDIRSAIMAVQFACTASATGSNSMTKKKGGELNARVVMELVTRREQSLVLFHLLGKLMYNKRKPSEPCRLQRIKQHTGKGDPPNTNASAKELQRDRDIDSQLKSQPALPDHLKDHKRRTSRVDIEVCAHMFLVPTRLTVDGT